MPKAQSFLVRHSLSLVCLALLLLWIVLYSKSDPDTRLGSFFGNAIADWTGVVVTLLATKYLYERAPRKKPSPTASFPQHLRQFLHDHILTLSLLITAALWIALYLDLNPQSKWGQVTGNIISEWTQILGFVLLTKRFIERNAPKHQPAKPSSKASGNAV